MSQHTSIPFHSVLAFTLLAGFALPAAGAADARVIESYGKLPLQFEVNRGQTHKDVHFLSRGPGYSLYLTSGEAVLVLAKPHANAKHDARNTQGQPDVNAQVESTVVRMRLVGAARRPLVSGVDPLPGKANYFIGKDPANWRTNVPTFARVHYREVYPGIDVVYYGNQRQLEYDFVVAPGADPEKIVLGFKGADKLEIDAQGELALHVAGGEIHQHKPVIYQEMNGIRQEIAGGYVRKGAKRIGFEVASYDRSRPLIIDPVVLSYSTYLGGSGNDIGRGIAVDAAGSAYVAGDTISSNFPTTAGAFDTSPNGVTDVFVTKLDATGSALVYSTLLGSSSNDSARGIAVDSTGAAYVTGVAGASDFPTTAGAFASSSNGGADAFVIKLDQAGSTLVYSTFLGGSDLDSGASIALDATGAAYVAGFTFSTNFPTTAGAFDTSHNGNRDAFVAKLDTAGSALIYSTFLGGSDIDEAFSIAVDTDGNAYVTGQTFSSNFPTTLGAFQPIYGGFGDAFVTKLNPTGSGLDYSTFLGGSFVDTGNGIAVDAANSAYVTGSTFSPNFPTTPGAFQPIVASIGGLSGSNAFVTKLIPVGSLLVYSTFLGGSNDDAGNGITVDATGNAYVTGQTSSSDFPTTAGAFDTTFNGDGSDAFVTKLNPIGSALVYSTYLAGAGTLGRGTNQGHGIAIDATGAAYVTGLTASSNFPTTPGAFQPTFGGATDAFVAKIVDDASPPPTATQSSAAHRPR